MASQTKQGAWPALTRDHAPCNFGASPRHAIGSPLSCLKNPEVRGSAPATRHVGTLATTATTRHVGTQPPIPTKMTLFYYDSVEIPTKSSHVKSENSSLIKLARNNY